MIDRARRFRLRKASFKGKGLSADATRLGWDRLWELAYKGRGGDSHRVAGKFKRDS